MPDNTTLINIELPTGDHTPAAYEIPIANFNERIKYPFRRWLYPIINKIQHPFLARSYNSITFQPDLWLWGQRGNDFERHRRRDNRLFPLKNSRILVAGCGTGRDIESWLMYQPQQVIGCDWFNYEKAWNLWHNRFKKISPNTSINFVQSDLAKINTIKSESVDIVASDAVFEHLRNYPQVLKEFHRILRPNGLVYATFGALWFTWGGDHVSGYEHINSGYNHLIVTTQSPKNQLHYPYESAPASNTRKSPAVKPRRIGGAGADAV